MSIPHVLRVSKPITLNLLFSTLLNVSRNVCTVCENQRSIRTYVYVLKVPTLHMTQTCQNTAGVICGMQNAEYNGCL